MERVLERQAELIGQYEEEEKAQREWEKQYNENRIANKGSVEVEHKPYQVKNGREQSNQLATITDKQVHCDVEAKCDKNLRSTSNPSDERLPNGSLLESPQNASQEYSAHRREATDEPDHRCAQTASISAQESSNNSTITRHDQDRGDENSDGHSGYNTNAQSPRHHTIKAPSEGSPSSDTLDSKVSEWSSSQFQDHGQVDTRPYGQTSSIVDVGSVLEALQRARISLKAKLSKPVPPSQVMLALPAPGDEHKEHDDQPANNDDNSYKEELSSSSPARQEVLALPAPEDYHESEDLPVNDTANSLPGKLSSSSPPREEILALPAPGDDYRREIEDSVKIPVSTPGLFRLPTDSFPADQKMFSSNAYGSRFSLEAATRHGTGFGFSAKQCYDLHGSGLLSVPTSGRCNSIPRPEFTVESTTFLSGIPGLEEDLRRGRPLGDADLFMQRAVDYTISNKWML
uniref:Uncharacterized protein n=1 Tax=Arundo donax TaxID=35708 RepID=A0A0A8ZSM4_ARUDO